MNSLKWVLGLIILLSNITCNINNGDRIDPIANLLKSGQIDYWLTKGDQSILLAKQKPVDFYSNSTNNYPTIDVDTSTSYQKLDGFGYSLTGGSAGLIHKMGTFQKNALLHEMFSCINEMMCISYLRISMVQFGLH